VTILGRSAFVGAQAWDRKDVVSPTGRRLRGFNCVAVHCSVANLSVPSQVDVTHNIGPSGTLKGFF